MLIEYGPSVVVSCASGQEWRPGHHSGPRIGCPDRIAERAEDARENVRGREYDESMGRENERMGEEVLLHHPHSLPSSASASVSDCGRPSYRYRSGNDRGSLH